MFKGTVFAGSVSRLCETPQCYFLYRLISGRSYHLLGLLQNCVTFIHFIVDDQGPDRKIGHFTGLV